METAGGAYTLTVRVAKFALPLVALGILSTLFLLARQAPQGEPLQYVDSDVADLAQTQQLGAAEHAGVSDDGTGMDLTADRVWADPADEDITRGETLRGVFDATDGYVYDVVAARGRTIGEEDMSYLEGGVTVRMSNGYVMRTEAVRVKNDQTYLTSLAPVHGEGPLGTIDAGRMEIFAQSGDTSRRHVVFRDGVRVYHVPAPEEPE